MASVAARRIRFMREGANPCCRVADFDTGMTREAPERRRRSPQRVAPSATRSRSINCV